MRIWLQAAVATLLLLMGIGSAHAAECHLGVEVPKTTTIPGIVFVAFSDRDIQCFGMYENGKIAMRRVPIYDKRRRFIGWEDRLLFGWASTGMSGYETPLSDPHKGPQRVNRAVEKHWSQEFQAWMPHTLFFDEKGRAVHGGDVTEPMRSHGCIRVSLAAAHGIFNGFNHRDIQVIVTRNRDTFESDWEQGYFGGQVAAPQTASRKRFRWENDAGFVIDPDMHWHEE